MRFSDPLHGSLQALFQLGRNVPVEASNGAGQYGLSRQNIVALPGVEGTHRHDSGSTGGKFPGHERLKRLDKRRPGNDGVDAEATR